MNILKLWRGLGKVVARRTGPNDMKCVVWLLVSVLLFFSLFFFLHTDYVYIYSLINVWRDWQEGIKKKTGPNNTFCVVWAISKCFFFIISFFYTYLLFYR